MSKMMAIADNRHFSYDNENDLVEFIASGMVREFWELKGMHKLTETYEQVKYYLPSLLRLHKILNEQGMGEQEIINVLKLANNM
jgi:hypothetical protein